MKVLLKLLICTEGNLEIINYKGTEEQWKKISIKDSNYALENLKINFNSKYSDCSTSLKCSYH